VPRISPFREDALVDLTWNACRKTGKSLSALHAADETETINIRVRIMNARNLPKMDKGSCDCYVRVKLAGKEFQTKVTTSVSVASVLVGAALPSALCTSFTQK
jgi:hypothetical protein